MAGLCVEEFAGGAAGGLGGLFLGEFVRHMTGHETGEQAEGLQPRRGVQADGGEYGERVLHDGEGVRAEGLPGGQGGRQPGVASHDRALFAGDAPEVGAPVAGGFGRQPVVAAHLVDHELQQRLLVGDVAVEGHRSGPDPGRDRAHRDRREPLGVGEGDGLGGDLGATVRGWPAPPRAFGLRPQHLGIHTGTAAG